MGWAGGRRQWGVAGAPARDQQPKAPGSRSNLWHCLPKTRCAPAPHLHQPPVQRQQRSQLPVEQREAVWLRAQQRQRAARLRHRVLPARQRQHAGQHAQQLLSLQLQHASHGRRLARQAGDGRQRSGCFGGGRGHGRCLQLPADDAAQRGRLPQLHQPAHEAQRARLLPYRQLLVTCPRGSQAACGRHVGDEGGGRNAGGVRTQDAQLAKPSKGQQAESR